ncbi:hypothetical protein BpHYR1_049063 [Brachionus plicatilis]|uniref:HAT C-terminal dimerisation domain-containing protein n=1 Tax=Brachionus plicatilis TaxID=10195 RepID=A0A3M7SP10_BRAPC|nr:hypothetical protein BpHYR1_049063 [Brachionus plicatilis]
MNNSKRGIFLFKLQRVLLVFSIFSLMLSATNNYSTNFYFPSIIRNIITKFDYELNSPIYLGAAVLNVGAVEAWPTRSYCKLYFEKGLKSLFKSLAKKKKQISKLIVRLIVKLIIKIIIYLIKTLVNDMLMVLTSQLRSVDDNDCDDAELLNKKYNTEIDRLKILSREVKINSNREFWNKYGKELPNLYSLTLRLSSIPLTSAFVERFFNCLKLNTILIRYKSVLFNFFLKNCIDQMLIFMIFLSKNDPSNKKSIIIFMK